MVTEGSASPDGTFALEIPAEKGLVLTIIGNGNRVLRRPLRANRVDLGNVELPFLEFPPGIDGQAWDERLDRPVIKGIADLRRRSEVIASRMLDGNGTFWFELTRRRLLTPGTYHVALEAPGYRSTKSAVEITDDATSYRLGRIELTPSRKG